MKDSITLLYKILKRDMKNKNLPDNAIEISGLSKEYKGVGGAKDLLALDSIDLKIPRGSMFGLLGPNWCW